MKLATTGVCVLSLWVLSPSSPAAAPDDRFDVTATLYSLPSSKPCLSETVNVTTRYLVDSVGQGAPPGVAPGSTILVVHQCPRRSRGWSRQAQGTAARMRVSDRHHLTLRTKPLQTAKRSPSSRRHQVTVDPFPADLRRFRPLQTDKAPYPPRMVVTTRGGGGTYYRIVFDRREVSVGSSPKADVMLVDAAVAPLHLRLRADGDKVVVHRMGAAATTIDGERVDRPRAINYRSRITVGPYSLSVSLLTKPWYASRDAR